jgi:hypothetical protein
LPTPLDDLAKIFTGAPTTSPVEVTTTAAPEEDAAECLTTPATPAEGEPTGTSSAPAALDASIAALSLEAEGTAVAAEEAALASASFSTPEYYFPSGQSEWHPPHPLFDLEQLGIDRRLVRPPRLPSFAAMHASRDLTSPSVLLPLPACQPQEAAQDVPVLDAGPRA